MAWVCQVPNYLLQNIWNQYFTGKILIRKSLAGGFCRPILNVTYSPIFCYLSRDFFRWVRIMFHLVGMGHPLYGETCRMGHPSAWLIEVC